MRSTNIFTIAALVLFAGCTQNLDTTTDIQDELSELLNSDELLMFVGLEDDDALDLEYISGIEGDEGRVFTDTLWPDSDEYRIRFGRSRDSLVHIVDWEIDEENGVAIASITRTLFGTFRIVALDSSHTVVDSFVKPIESIFTQQVRFIENTDENGRPWRVDAFTVGNGVEGEKVSINLIEVSDPETDESFAVFDNTNEFISRDSIPEFTFRSPYLLEVSVSNTGPEFPYRSGEMVMLHYGRGRNEKGRLRLGDMGIGADAVENDNTFSRIWRAHGPGIGHQRRVFMAWFDVIDYSSLFVEGEPIHSELWRIPYRIVR